MPIDEKYASKTGISSYGSNLIIMSQTTATPEQLLIFQEELKLCKNDYDVWNLVMGEA